MPHRRAQETGGKTAGATSWSERSLKVYKFQAPGDTLSPELVHRVIRHGPRLRNILEAAPQRVVMPDAGPVDSQRGVNRGLDILGVHVAFLRPAVNRGV